MEKRDKNPMKVAIYARNTGKLQDRINEQVEICKEFIKDRNVEEIHIYSDFREKDGLEKLLNDIDSGKISCVVVYCLNRLSRNSMEVLNMTHIFETKGVTFLAVKEKIDTSVKSNGMQYHLNFFTTLVKYEGEIIREAVHQGEAIQQGEFQ